MKRIILSASIALFGALVLAPAALANRQLSTPNQLSGEATIHNLVQHNRDVRNKK